MAENRSVDQLGMFASALAGRPVAVSTIARGEPAWTDGTTVYVDAEASPSDLLETLAVQASLIAAGSFSSDIVHRLARQQSLIPRYLAIEARRALGTVEDVLPLRLAGLATEHQVPESAAESLAVAASRAVIADPPSSFGTIKARKLESARRAAEKSQATAVARHRPRDENDLEKGSALRDLDDDAETDDGEPDLFSSPVGGGGAIGRLLARMLDSVRQLGGGGPPGADSPTHQRRAASRSAGAVTSSLTPASDDDRKDAAATGFRYPEWDFRRKRYRPDWCTVHQTEARRLGEGVSAPDGHALRRSLTRLGMGLSRHHRQAGGDDIDVDAAVELRVDIAAGSAPDDRVYVDNLRRRRDLSVLILLDVSGSAAEAGEDGHTVHEQQRSAAAALATALHELGDRVALFAYNSQGRSAVHLTPVKRFDDRFDTAALRRLYGLTPAAYSRLGAAIRHGATILGDAGTPWRLLVVISDGLAYDHGYERAYGAADARHALAEVGAHGIGCVCLTVGASTDSAELRRVFGTAAHAGVARPEQLSSVIGPLFRVALNRAGASRRKPT